MYVPRRPRVIYSRGSYYLLSHRSVHVHAPSFVHRTPYVETLLLRIIADYGYPPSRH